MGYIRVLFYLPGAAESPGAAMIAGGGNKEDVPLEVVNTTEVEVNVTVAEVIPVQVIGLMFSSGGSGSIEQTPDKTRYRKSIAVNITTTEKQYASYTMILWYQKLD